MLDKAHALYNALLCDLSHVIDPALPGWAPDSTPREVGCYQLRDSLLKKYCPEDKPTTAACDKALKKFLEVNDACGSYSLEDRMEFIRDEELVNGVRDAMRRFWLKDQGPIISDFHEVFRRGRAGPGSGVSARDTDLYTKMFDSPLSCTGDLHYIWSKCVAPQVTFAEAEAFRHHMWGCTVVEGSKYSLVMKTTAIARGICTEPTINMWFQLGMGAILEDRLKSVFGVDLSTQPEVNRMLAKRGSTTGRFATIDLASASDSLALPMLRHILPRSMLSTLSSVRSPVTRLPSGQMVQLNMVSTMGNGFTFPLMTSVFCCVVQSVYSYLGIPMVRDDGTLPDGRKRSPGRGRNFGVFGDDIIVDDRAVRLVLRTLYLLGFEVNSDKTFVEGRFRESCGADYVSAVNVRGVYIKSLKTKQDLFSAINNLNRWSARLGVSLTETVSLLLSWVKSPYRHLVPPDEDDAAGLHVPASYARAVNYRISRIGIYHYTPMVPVNWEFYILGGVVWTYREQVQRSYNPSGLLVSFLAGSIRGCTVVLRQKRPRYTAKRKTTPRWDYLPPRRLEDPIGWTRRRRFISACDTNLVRLGLE
jgi:hypothetical protein